MSLLYPWLGVVGTLALHIQYPFADELSRCYSVQVAAGPLIKTSFKSGLEHRTIFGYR
jgi:hypothetical protein